MPPQLAAGLLRLSALYLLAGSLLLPWLYRRAWPAAAPGAHGATWGFHVATLPGTLLLWPVLLLRARHPVVLTGDEPRILRRAQTILALLAAAMVIVALVVSLGTRSPRTTVDRLPPALTEGR